MKTNQVSLRDSIREIVEKHVLPQVKSKSKKDKKLEPLATKALAYSLGLDEVVDSYVEDFSKLLTQILEGLPCEEKDMRYEELDTGIGIDKLVYDGQDREMGYNQHVKEIKQYREWEDDLDDYIEAKHGKITFDEMRLFIFRALKQQKQQIKAKITKLRDAYMREEDTFEAVILDEILEKI